MAKKGGSGFRYYTEVTQQMPAVFNGEKDLIET